MLLAGETLSVGNLGINQAPSQRSIGIRLRGLKGLGALFEFGGFVGAAEFAEGLGLGGQVADEIGRVGTVLFFDESYHASVARGGFFCLAGGIVRLTESGDRHGELKAVLAVYGLKDFQSARHDGFCFGKVFLREVDARQAAECGGGLVAIFAVRFYVEFQRALEVRFGSGEVILHEGEHGHAL